MVRHSPKILASEDKTTSVEAYAVIVSSLCKDVVNFISKCDYN